MEKMNRRELLAGALGVSAGAIGTAALTGGGPGPDTLHRSKEKSLGRRMEADLSPGELGDADWSRIREAFILEDEYIHLAGMLITSHPDPVRRTIASHNEELDRNPTLHLVRNNRQLDRELREEAARYLGVGWQEVAITDSTTMGLGLVYNGVEVQEDQELLTTEHDYYSTHESLRYKSRRSGADIRRVTLYDDPAEADAKEMVGRLMEGVNENTRVVAVTWVHSSTGVKIPVRRIADALAEENRGRSPARRAILCVDGVHGLGVEPEDMEELGCDVLIAGTHKWMFAPRGTGIFWASPQVHDQFSPTIPTFYRYAGWGGTMSPGGFKSFEFRWAMADAFRFHLAIGKERVTQRVHQLSRRAKEGLFDVPGIRLITPMPSEVSAGIVCFQVEGMNPTRVVRSLRERGIVASTTPYTPSYARLSPAVFNTAQEVDLAVESIRDLA